MKKAVLSSENSGLQKNLKPKQYCSLFKKLPSTPSPSETEVFLFCLFVFLEGGSIWVSLESHQVSLHHQTVSVSTRMNITVIFVATWRLRIFFFVFVLRYARSCFYNRHTVNDHYCVNQGQTVTSIKRSLKTMQLVHVCVSTFSVEWSYWASFYVVFPDISGKASCNIYRSPFSGFALAETSLRAQAWPFSREQRRCGDPTMRFYLPKKRKKGTALPRQWTTRLDWLQCKKGSKRVFQVNPQ